MAGNSNDCLGCGKKFTNKEAAVRCSICGLWSHKACSGLTNDFFNALAEQYKLTKRTYWACRACSTYAEGMSHRLREVSEKADEAIRVGQENSSEIVKLKEEVEKEKERADRNAKKLEAEMMEEMTRREERRRNIVIHGLKEPVAAEGRKRMEEDRKKLDEIFTIIDVNVHESSDVEFCRRVGEKSEKARPLVVGFFTEWAKETVLKYTKNLAESEMSEVTIVPDLTEKQRRAEKDLLAEAERRNRDELTNDDVSKNLSWKIVGRKGQKRLVKAFDGNRGNRGAGRGRGAVALGRGLLPAPEGSSRGWVPRGRGPGRPPGRGAAVGRGAAQPSDDLTRKRTRQGSDENQQQPRKRGTRAMRGEMRRQNSSATQRGEESGPEMDQGSQDETEDKQVISQGREADEEEETGEAEEGIRLGASQQC
jgi:hypothetical protein